MERLFSSENSEKAHPKNLSFYIEESATFQSCLETSLELIRHLASFLRFIELISSSYSMEEEEKDDLNRLKLFVSDFNSLTSNFNKIQKKCQELAQKFSRDKECLAAGNPKSKKIKISPNTEKELKKRKQEMKNFPISHHLNHSAVSVFARSYSGMVSTWNSLEDELKAKGHKYNPDEVWGHINTVKDYLEKIVEVTERQPKISKIFLKLIAIINSQTNFRFYTPEVIDSSIVKTPEIEVNFKDLNFLKSAIQRVRPLYSKNAILIDPDYPLLEISFERSLISKSLNSKKNQLFDVENYFDNNVKPFMAYISTASRNSEYSVLKILSLRCETIMDYKVFPPVVFPHWMSIAITPNGRIFTIGGADDLVGHRCDDVYEHFLRENKGHYRNERISKYKKRAFLNTPRDVAACIVLNGFIYIIGGRNSSGQYISDCERYDLNNDVWTPIASCPTPAGQSTICTYSKRYILKMGGWTVRYELANTIERYDTLTGKWIILMDQRSPNHPNKLHPQFNIPSCHICHEIGENRIASFGGWYTTLNSLSNIYFEIEIEDETAKIVNVDKTNFPNHAGFWEIKVYAYAGSLYFLACVEYSLATGSFLLPVRKVFRFSSEGFRILTYDVIEEGFNNNSEFDNYLEYYSEGEVPQNSEDEDDEENFYNDASYDPSDYDYE